MTRGRGGACQELGSVGLFAPPGRKRDAVTRRSGRGRHPAPPLEPPATSVGAIHSNNHKRHSITRS